MPADGPEEAVPTRPEDVAATFCAVLVDEWERAGVTDAVVCPGSRSTPMALALHRSGRIRVQVHHDERAAGFVGLGLGLASGRPAVVLTTSGTAAVELHPAVVEAHHAGVPLVAVTADRPPELADVGAGQTIDQVHLYGRAVRWFVAPGVPDHRSRDRWRPLGARVVVEAHGRGAAARPGPVHLDLAFREPLVGRPGPLPPGRPDGRAWTVAPPVPVRPAVGSLAEVLGGARRGLIVAGAEPGGPAEPGSGVAGAAPRLASALGWPVLVDARVRGGLPAGAASVATVVGMADAILRHPPAAAGLAPDVVLHLGSPPASRVLNEWITAAGPLEVRVGRHGWIDPDGRGTLRLACSAADLADALDGPSGGLGALTTTPEPGWAAGWARAEQAAQAATDRVLAAHPEVTEPGVARDLLATLGAGTNLVVSSSMPVRDLEWYGRPRSGLSVFANRGANGIDGVLSTAVGVALATDRPTVCLLGDVALLHDSNSLIGSAGRGIDLTVVVVDNDGGGIFSFLAQAEDPGGEEFETLFGTPHGVDLATLAAAHGVPTVEPARALDLAPAVEDSLRAGGVRLVRVVTDRRANVAVHREIHAAVAAALESSRQF